MTTEQKRTACAELDKVQGVVPNYPNDYNAILPLIAKWAGDNEQRWENFLNEVGTTINHRTKNLLQCRITEYKLTPLQLTDALLKAANKYED